MKLPVFLLILFVAAGVFAQAPEAIHYQGALRDADGNIAASVPIELRITIFANQQQAYSETHSVTTSQLGLFDLSIGNGIGVTGEMSEIDWSAGDAEILTELYDEESGSFEELSRRAFQSVPYALFANSNSLWQLQGDNIYYNQGNVGIGTAIVNYPFEVHTEGSILTFGNTVNGNPKLSLHHRLGPAGEILTNYSINQNPTLQLGFGATQGSGRSINFRMAGNDYMTILGNGNIGVNTIAPTTRLHVGDGDIYLDNPNRGVIMKSSNGQCWRLSVSNSGTPEFESVACPQ